MRGAPGMKAKTAPPRANSAGYGTAILLASTASSTAPSKIARSHSRMIMRDPYISPGANRCAECRTLGGGQNSLASQPSSLLAAALTRGYAALCGLSSVGPRHLQAGRDGGTLLRLLQDDQLAPQETGGLR